MSHDITGLHHVGHIVADIGASAEIYRRLGFHVSPPGFPAWRDDPAQSGNKLVPFGAGNAHIDFRHDFVELVTAGGADLPADARLIPIDVPVDRREATFGAIRATSAYIGEFLARFEGLHITMFESPDPWATAERLDRAQIAYRGVHHISRPVWTEDGRVSTEAASYLGFGADARMPEGRVGAASNAPPAVREARKIPAHANGATSLTDSALCVPDAELDAHATRYSALLDREPRRVDHGRIFELGASTLTLVRASRLNRLLPGTVAPGLPAFVSFTTAVTDLDATVDLLRGNGFNIGRTLGGDPFVPAAQTTGATVVFTRA
ncbi:VOC family protein [Phytomonospora sp. NPDC050363]|uniref:VOC family protein n=1 Tax=Phytomonospora sp. NPDC050363 TaxID=3155642 RepID=UPI0033F933BF